jgi:hypothetical protein
MPFSSTFTLTAGSSSNTGPFSIVGQPGSVSVATGVTRAQLLTGMTYHNIDNSVTAFTITSSGTCTNSISVSASPTPTPTPTPTEGAGSGFYYSTVTGTYPVTSPGSAQLRIYNYTSDPKYIYLTANSTYITSGSLTGSATMDPGGASESSTSIDVTITGQNQLEYGTNSSYLYIPAMTYYNFNIVHTNPSAGSFYFTYTDTSHPTKTNIPLQS